MQDILEREPKTTPRADHREPAPLSNKRVRQEKKANFIGQWAPTLLIFGLYNKMVRLHGSESV